MRSHVKPFIGVLLASVLALVGAGSCAQSAQSSANDPDHGGDASVDLQGLVSLSVTPTAASLALVYGAPIAPATEQLTAIGTYKDGSTKDVTRSVSWAVDADGPTLTAGLFSTQIAGQFRVTA